MPDVVFALLQKDTMPVERMRMRPWLEEQINSNMIPGLKWLSKVSVCVCVYVCECVCVSVRERSLLKAAACELPQVKLFFVFKIVCLFITKTNQAKVIMKISKNHKKDLSSLQTVASTLS